MVEFRIADTFTASLARLTGDEQKAVKTTAFNLQVNPSGTGMSFHKLDRARDKNFWSVRASGDLRLIIHHSPESLLLCYTDHHDKAYAWAERRKLETHPQTGAAQLVEIRETVQEIVVPLSLASGPRLFAGVSDDELLGYGVPTEWLADARHANEDSLFDLAAHLPAEAAEALLMLATGGRPEIRAPVSLAADLLPAQDVVSIKGDPFAHPDAQRRFRIVNDVEELERALDSPWDRWLVFLHPAQRAVVERHYAGPARVAGSAGTGKTVAAIHRAAFLGRTNPDARVLLTTFSDPLANALRRQLGRLIINEPRLQERVEVSALDTIAKRLFERTNGHADIAPSATVEALLAETAGASGDHRFSLPFLVSEWEEIVDAWQLASWDAYRDIARLGRRTRLPENRRQAAWAIFERVHTALAGRGLVTQAGLYGHVESHFAAGQRLPYDFVVVDEAQDVSVPQLRFLAALGGGRPDSLFFAGDLGQRIFQLPFSWRSLGVDVRGRSSALRVNYRTSHQIRAQADRLLGLEIADVDGNTEHRGGTISVFNGRPPTVAILDTSDQEVAAVANWLGDRVREGLNPEEIAIFVRSEAQIARAQKAVDAAGLSAALLDELVETTRGRVAVGTMHLSKGPEFRAVIVMACDDDVIPLQERIESVADEADLEETYDTERHLLYVACTRARDHLLVAGVAPASEFLADLTT